MAELYQIRLREHVDNRWADRFEGFHLVHEDGGTTLLVGSVVDQAALHGLLARVRDLGLTLLSVNQAGVSGGAREAPLAGPAESQRGGSE
jgi:hypothetical protein